MARARNIKPGFFRNSDLVELPFEARLLFIGLWTIADRDGRMEDRPKQIKMEIFPADSVDCDDLLDKLAAIGVIERYTHDAKRFLHIVNFSKHQNPHKDEKASTIPNKCGDVADTSYKSKKHDASTVQAPCESDATSEPNVLIPDSLLLIPESKEAKASSSGSTNLTDVDQKTAKVATCPIDVLIDLYEKTLPSMPRVRRSLFKTGKNGTAMRQRWAWVMTSMHERGERAGTRLAETTEQGVAWFDRYFAYVADSKFLTESFAACDLGWLVAKENFEKVLSGRYENREGVAA